MDKIHIEGAEAQATSPEGRLASMPLGELMGRLSPKRFDSGELIYPDGVKAIRSEGPLTVVIHETPAQVYNLKWIAGDSAAPYGQGAKYRNVRIALPYLVTLLVFRNGPGTQALTLSELNECFFRVAPLENFEDELLFPALLNCSKFTPPEGRPLSWICTQHLNYASVNREATPARRMRAGYRALMRELIETGYNYSSEKHEGASWFSESRGVDPRISTIERWEEATTADPLFVLEVPWLKTGLSLGHIVERIFKNHGALNGAAWTSATLARHIFNYKPATPANGKKA